MGAKTILADNEIDGKSIASALGVSYHSFVNNHSAKIIKVRHGAWNKADAEAYINHVRKNWSKEPIDFDKLDGWNINRLVSSVDKEAYTEPTNPIKSFHVEDLSHGGIAVRFEMQGYTAVDFLSHFSRMLNPPANVELKREDGAI